MPSPPLFGPWVVVGGDGVGVLQHGMIPQPASPPAADLSTPILPIPLFLNAAVRLKLTRRHFPGLVQLGAPPLPDYRSTEIPRPLIFSAAGRALNVGVGLPYRGLVATPAPPAADLSTPAPQKVLLFPLGVPFDRYVPPTDGISRQGPVIQPATAATYGLTGQPAGATVKRVAQTAAGSYGLTGTSLKASVQRLAKAGSGTYGLTGPGEHGTDTVGAVAGAYGVTGQAAKSSVQRRAKVAAGTYGVTGPGEHGTDTVGAVRGSYGLTGKAVKAVVTRLAKGGAGVYGLVGTVLKASVQRVRQAVAGLYTLTGLPATRSTGTAFLSTTTGGAYGLTGASATATHHLKPKHKGGGPRRQRDIVIVPYRTHVVGTQPGAYGLVGLPAGAWSDFRPAPEPLAPVTMLPKRLTLLERLTAGADRPAAPPPRPVDQKALEALLQVVDLIDLIDE